MMIDGIDFPNLSIIHPNQGWTPILCFDENVIGQQACLMTGTDVLCPMVIQQREIELPEFFILGEDRRDCERQLCAALTRLYAYGEFHAMRDRVFLSLRGSWDEAFKDNPDSQEGSGTCVYACVGALRAPSNASPLQLESKSAAVLREAFKHGVPVPLRMQARTAGAHPPV